MAKVGKKFAKAKEAVAVKPALRLARSGERGGEGRLRQVRRDGRGGAAPRRRSRSTPTRWCAGRSSCPTGSAARPRRSWSSPRARSSRKRRTRAPTTWAARTWSTEDPERELAGLRRHRGHARHDEVGREAREGAGPARPHAEPQDGHRHLRRRQGGARDQGRQGGVPRRQDRRSSTRPSARSRSAPDKLLDNAKALIDSVIKAKPPAAKGKYVKSIALSSTMGPGVRVDLASVEAPRVG